ncbi:MAG: hypothetical protein QOE20_4902 [Mycobacterium sp.]|nr:hypothetical protein [Mycobacterium sp.]
MLVTAVTSTSVGRRRPPSARRPLVAGGAGRRHGSYYDRAAVSKSQSSKLVSNRTAPSPGTRVTDGRGVGDGAEEFEELCGTHDGVGNRSGANQLFLQQLRPEVPTLRCQPLGAHDGQRNVMSHTGTGFGVE